MKTFILILMTMAVSTVSFAGEKWNKTKQTINEGAENVDQGTRKVINKGKQKMEERQKKSKKNKQKSED